MQDTQRGTAKNPVPKLGNWGQADDVFGLDGFPMRLCREAGTTCPRAFSLYRTRAVLEQWAAEWRETMPIERRCVADFCYPPASFVPCSGAGQRHCTVRMYTRTEYMRSQQPCLFWRCRRSRCQMSSQEHCSSTAIGAKRHPVLRT